MTYDPAYSRLYYLKHKSKLLGAARERRLADLEAAREREKIAQSTPEFKAFRRAKNLMRKYGLTVEQWQSMVDAQWECCAICFDALDLESRWGVVVDHDHKTGRVRGILCVKCNVGIGHLQESPRVLASAIVYLERHNA